MSNLFTGWEPCFPDSASITIPLKDDDLVMKRKFGKKP